MSYRHFAFLLLTSGLAFAQKPMSNDDVLRLIEKHTPTESIIQQINAAPSGFRLDFEDIDKLQRAGVPEIVVKAMNARQIGKRLDIRGVEIPPISMMPTPTMAAVDPTPPAPTRRISENGWALGTGRPEVGVRVGGGSFVNSGFGGTNMWNVGASVGVGITKHVAAIGEYAYTDFRGGSFVPLGVAHDKLHDLIGGVRLGLGTRVDPYFFAGGGMAHLDGSAVTLFGAGKLSWTHPAVAFGGGINYTIRHGIGIQWDNRFVRPTDFVWYARSTGGIYFRF